MKPIEPGCLCVITGGQQLGQSITVVVYVGELYKEKDVWEVDRELTWCSGWKEITLPYIPQEYLMRIDGYEPETQDVPEELTA